jgi:hypothetical protein
VNLAALKAKYDPGNWSGSTKASGRLPSEQRPDNLSPEDIQKLEKAEVEALEWQAAEGNVQSSSTGASGAPAPRGITATLCSMRRWRSLTVVVVLAVVVPTMMNAAVCKCKRA